MITLQTSTGHFVQSGHRRWQKTARCYETHVPGINFGNALSGIAMRNERVPLIRKPIHQAPTHWGSSGVRSILHHKVHSDYQSTTGVKTVTVEQCTALPACIALRLCTITMLLAFPSQQPTTDVTSALQHTATWQFHESDWQNMEEVSLRLVCCCGTRYCLSYCLWCPDSILHMIEDFSIFQSLRDIIIAPLWQFRL